MAAGTRRGMFVAWTLMVLCTCGCITTIHSQLTVLTRPEALVSSSRNVVEGSVIQIYCTVEMDTTVTFTWTLNGTALLNDPPHIRIRQENLPERSASLINDKDSTSVLTVDNFRDTDNGVYQCTANGTASFGNGTSVSITAVSSTVDGTLVLTNQPSENEPIALLFDTFPLPNDNRTGIASGTDTPTGNSTSDPLLTCTAGHNGDELVDYSPPSVVWVRNGQAVDTTDSRITLTSTNMTNGRVTSSLTITKFTAGDAGVYQCVFTDDSEGGDTEVITSIPYRLDTGSTIRIERVSPEVIILRPPEKLVIEVRVPGDYNVLFWNKGTSTQSIPGLMEPQELPNFYEIFTRDNTTNEDRGIYIVTPQFKTGTESDYTIEPSGVDFAVTSPEDASTTALSESPVIIPEGDNVDISCRSVGAPVPSIIWEFNNMTTMFEQTDVATPFQASITGEAPNRIVELTPGNIESTLHIMNARYPDNDGVYTCIGTNADDLDVASSSAFITVQVHVLPEVNVVTNSTLINLGETVTIDCSVQRGNPSYNSFTIIYNDSTIVSTGQSHTLTNIQEADLGTYRCVVTNDAGTGNASLTIEEGVPPSVTTLQPAPVVVDTTVDLVCVVTGDTPIDIVWEHVLTDGSVEEVFTGNDTTGGNFTLTVNINDYGTYRCSASNRFGMNFSSVNVIQAVAPLISTALKDIEVTTGSPLGFSVIITEFNLPLTEIIWSIDGTPVTEANARITITNTDTITPPATSELTLDPVQFPSDGGQYSVTAVNPAGMDNSTVTVTVTSATLITLPNAPAFVTETEGNQTTLTCTARGVPAPTFMWYRESELINSSDTRLKISSSEVVNNTTGFIYVTSQLNITLVNRSDAGMFRCDASNVIVGDLFDDSQTYQVTVNFPATILEDPIRDSAFAPDPVSVMCRASGLPVPTITWMRTAMDGSQTVLFPSSNITEQDDGVTRASTLYINSTSIMDTGNYSCRAVNEFGNVISDPVEVVIYVGTQIVSPMTGDDLRVNETMDITISCMATGLPAPTISFWRGSDQLGSSRFMRGIDSAVMLGDGRYQVTAMLILTNATDEDTGTVTCQAINTVEELNQTMMDIATFNLTVNVAPSITVPPMSVSVVSPDPAMFSCTADGVPRPDITWLRVNNGTEMEVIEDSFTQITTTTLSDRLTMSVLAFNETQPSRSGVYVCSANNILEPARATADLTVNDIPRILIPMEDFTYVVNETNSIIFECSASGIPAPTISWFRVNQTMSTMLTNGTRSLIAPPQVTTYELPDGRGTASLVTSTLTIPATQDDDSGQYACQAVNDFRNETRQFELIVQVAPSITASPMNVSAVSPDPAMFSCYADGVPRPNITWIRVMSGTEMEVMEDSSTQITTTIFNDRFIMSILTFSETQPSRSGVYVCSAANLVDTVGAMAELTVNDIPQIMTPVENFTYTANETNAIIFECSASGIPAPTISWFRVNQSMPTILTNDTRSLIAPPQVTTYELPGGRGTASLVTSTLTIPATQDEDSGRYACQAVNDFGNETREFELIVQVAPSFITPPMNVSVVSPEPAMFSCTADGVPRPNITWLRVNNGTDMEVLEDSFTQITTTTLTDRLTMSVLTFNETQPFRSGVYVCLAANLVDSATAMAELTVNDIPRIMTPMENFTYIANETDTIIFECSASGIPSPIISWFRINQTMSTMLTNGTRSLIAPPQVNSAYELPGGRGTASLVTSTLTIPATRDEDSRQYACQAGNDFRNESREFELIVQVAPSITVPPMSVSVVSPDPAVFSCTADGVPRPDITWWRANNGTEMEVMEDSFTQITTSPVNGRLIMSILIFNETQPFRSGVYVCSAANILDPARATANLAVNDIPQIITPIENFIYTVNETNQVMFGCSASGIPTPTISWFRIDGNVSTVLVEDTKYLIAIPQVDDAYALPNGRGTAFLVTSTLTIPVTQDEDSGQYACQAVNDFGNETRAFDLVVQVAPDIDTLDPGSVEILEGMSATFLCTATGRPRPTITWYQTVGDSDTQKRVNVSDVRVTVTEEEMGDRELMSNLTLRSVLPSDAATYVCIAENIVDVEMSNDTLTVNVLPVVTSVYPEVGQMNYTVNESEPVTFECTATGIPDPDIEFNFSTIASQVQFGTPSTPIEVSRISDGEMVLQVTQTAMISSTVDSDSGVYECIATNDIPAMNSVQFELIVQVAPTFTQEPVDLTVIRGSNGVFECQASALPRPTISWEYYNPVSNITANIISDMVNYTLAEVTDNERLLTSTLTVLATDIADFGTYRCVATNVVAMASVQTILAVHVPPMITVPEPGQRLVVNATNPATFDCSATGIPTPDIQWYSGDLLLNGTGPGINTRVGLTLTANAPRGELGTAMSMLTINDTVGSDSGLYTCVATNLLTNYTEEVNGSDDENTDLFVQVPPEVVPLAGNQMVMTNETESATLSFRIDNAAPPVMVNNIRWFYSSDFAPSFDFDGSEITDLMKRPGLASAYSFSNDRLMLNITNIVQARRLGEPTDAGRYFLVATNEAGVSYSYIDLIVFGSPVIVEPPENQYVINDGSSAEFVCRALAFPNHTISWMFTNVSGVAMEIVSDGSKYFIVSDRSTTMFGELTVMNVDYEDRGVYTCTATNSIGFDTASANLTVHVTPMVRDTSDLTEVHMGMPAVLACLATGFPIPSISWRKDGNEVNIYSDSTLNSRIDVIEFSPDNSGSDLESSGYMGSGSIENLLMMHTSFTVVQVRQLGELGVVSLLSFEDTVRRDTANYTCTATNSLPETTTLMDMSGNIPLVILERPDPPTNVVIVENGARWVALRWTPGFDGNRPVTIVSINILTVNSEDNISINASDLMTSEGYVMYNISDSGRILPYTNYSFTVVSCNEIGCSDQSDPSPTVETDQDASSPPVDIMGEPNRTSIFLTWSEPNMPNGVISHYSVSFVGTRTQEGFSSHTGPGPDDMILLVSELVLPTGRLGTTLTDLFPNTQYEITVFAINGAGNGAANIETVTTLNAPPVPPTEEPTTVPPTNVVPVPRTVTIGVITFDETNGPISHYQIIVVFLPPDIDLIDLSDPDKEFPRSSLETYDDLDCGMKPSTPFAYVTAEMSSELYKELDGVFVVGHDMDEDPKSPNDRPESYTNGPLCYSTKYTFFVRAFSAKQMGQRAARQTDDRQYDLSVSSNYYPTETVGAEPVSDSTPIIAAVVIVVVVVLIIAIVIVVVLILVVRRRRTYVYKTTQHEVTDNGQNVEGLKLTEYRPPEEGTSLRHPIPVSLLPSHAERMHTNENCGFGEEYRIIQDNSPKNSVGICTTADNKPKNRYANIQCFDETRVVLTPIEGAEHDYINANFIDGYNHRKEYIAAQGPLPDTLGDFWRMVWDYNVPTIVMLTNLVEKMKIKCSQYWPNASHQQYANIDVTIVNTITQSDFVIRHFQIKKMNSDEVRDVRQFHFVSWPDFGVPRHATPLLHVLRRVRNMHTYSNERPLLIHCSAGVGRTGTLITIDVELQRAMKEGVIDPFNFVTKLREQRNFMVQTEAQYVFLHDAILEGVTSGTTEVKVEKLSQKFAELQMEDAEGESGFQKEYSRLRQFKVDVKEFTDANDDANKFKNRISNALPYNYNRVHLQMSPGVGGSDYINASYIDGYANKGCYIATQGPLLNTIDDFWRMVWEKEVHVIVMLTQLKEKGKEQCAQYWPDSVNSPEKNGSLSIELLSEKQFEDHTLRELKVSDVTSTDGKSRTVKQYHFTAWPEDGAPSSGAGMIDLIDQVTRTQAHTGNKPIVVHCSAGVGRTGAFCALSISIDRVKTEGVVDVFHCVKHLRTQRPHMVQSVEQYAFCYVAIREYIESLSSYSNFV